MKLISISKPQIEGVENAEDLVAYCARVSNPSNQMNTETAPKLLKYLIKHKHWSPFEMVSMTLEIKTSRAIAAQILRHRSFSFQEFCVSGDTEIYFDLPGGVKKSKRKPYKKKISKIYESWVKNENSRDRVANMTVRVYDEKTKKISNAKIKDVFKTGLKPIFEIELFNGKKIKCTKEHKFLTRNGFESLESCAGLSLNGNTASMSNKDVFIGCNGIPCHQSYDWMLEQQKDCIKNKTGVEGIAKKAKVSYHTIRKWLKIHNLRFTKKEVASYREVSNKNRFGYKTKGHSIETIEKMRKSARRGKDSNLWRGGSDRSERLKIADWCYSIRAEKLKESDYSCAKCGSNKKIELDHIKPVYSHKDLAYEKSNIQVLCRQCRLEKHKTAGDTLIWREKSAGNELTVAWSKIKKVKYLGEEMTYDMEIDHESHNYVANGIITHNSQRYSKSTKLTQIEYRKQGKTNRQVGDEPFELKHTNEFLINSILEKNLELYNDLIDEGVAKECARMVLPLCTETTMYMAGNLRSWIHYIDLRTQPETQKEHRKIAEDCEKIFVEQFPLLAEALEWK